MHPMKPHSIWTSGTCPRAYVHRIPTQRNTLWWIPFCISLLVFISRTGIMINQTYLYFTTFPGDKRWTRIFVACIFVLDMLNTLFDFAYLYDALIIRFGDVPLLGWVTWLFATGMQLNH
ncbi:hypothetical protein C8F04DRAFT_383171 [Mycena alexandri]|uniref:Uncharacterized protein n=1 Tax=Mycena alexandri TaxID=1745969 RepID=A0AAD6XA83_9AGAR|nr:hypothetical protein C8F04DRAFT_383171 [Mycena alexandri]